MLESLQLDIERLLEGVTDDGWQYLYNDLIAMCYRAPMEWISVMRRIVVSLEYVRAETHGDVSMEEESSDGEDTESEEEEED